MMACRALQRRTAACGCLLLLLLCWVPAIPASVQLVKHALSAEDLATHVAARGGFHLIGYCQAPSSSDCQTLQDLLAASDTDGSGIAAASHSSSTQPLHHTLLLSPPRPGSDRAASLSGDRSSSPTQLWFACHNGDSLQLLPLANPSGSSSGNEGGEEEEAWYLQPNLPTVKRLDLLQLAASQAVEQHGAACLKAQQQQHAAPSRQQHRQAGYGVLAMLRKAFNTLLLLLVVFAAGRFWPQLTALYQHLAAAGAAGQSSTLSSGTTASKLCGSTTTSVDGCSKLSGAQGTDLLGLQPADKLVVTAPGSAPSLPSAPTTPARATPFVDNNTNASSNSHPTGRAVSSGGGGLLLCAAPLPAPLRTLSTAASIDQLQMDNAQLAELVSQLHAEVGGSKAAAADASAAVQRQEAATHEALSCLQEQLVELDNRVTAVEEFGTAFNAAAVAAAAVAQRHGTLEQQQGGFGGGPAASASGVLSRYVSCDGDLAVSGGGGGGAAHSGGAAPTAPFAASASAVVTAAAAARVAAAGSAQQQQQQQDRQDNSTTSTAATGAVTGGNAASVSAFQLQRARSSKASASGAAAAAAAAAAASAAATAAAAAARGGAATEAALQQLCDLLVRQGVATVGALESLSAQVAATTPGSGGSGVRSGNAETTVATAAAAAVASQLVLLRAATVGIAALSDELKGIRPPLTAMSAAPAPAPGGVTGAAAAGCRIDEEEGTGSSQGADPEEDTASSSTTSKKPQHQDTKQQQTNVVEGAFQASYPAHGLVTPDKAAAVARGTGVLSPAPLPAASSTVRSLGFSSSVGGNAGYSGQDEGLVLSPAASQQAAAAQGKAPVDQPAVSPLGEAEEAAAATWAELQDKVKAAADSSRQAAAAAGGGAAASAQTSKGGAGGVGVTTATATAAAAAPGSDGWEEVHVAEEGTGEN